MSSRRFQAASLILIPALLGLLVGPSIAQWLPPSDDDNDILTEGGHLELLSRVLNKDEAAALGWPRPRGLKIIEVWAGTPAEKAGAKVGDIILTVDGVSIHGFIGDKHGTYDSWSAQIRPRLGYYLRLKRPGDVVELAIKRGREDLTIRVALGVPPPRELPACTGKDLIEEFARSDPVGYARVLAQTRAIPNSRGVLWRIEKAGMPLSHLFGTIHTTDQRVHRLSPAIWQAFNGARRLAVEFVVEQGPVAVELGEAHPKPADKSVSAPPKRLSDQLPPTTIAALRKALEKRGLSVDRLERATTLAEILYALRPVCEVARNAVTALLDHRLMEQARRRGLPVVGLETLQSRTSDVQLSTFSHLMGVESSVQDLDEVDDILETLTKAYLAREPKIYDSYLKHLHPDPRLPASVRKEMKAFGVQSSRRNHTMVNAALPLLLEGGLFIAVGVAHLSGEDGLVELFRKAGYEMTLVE